MAKKNNYTEQQALSWMESLCDRVTIDGRRQCLTQRCPMRQFWCFESGGPVNLYKHVNYNAKMKMLGVAYKCMAKEGVK